MAVSPFDRRKKTRRAQLEDVDKTALQRFKAANRVKRRLDRRDSPRPSHQEPNARTLPPGVTAGGHADRVKPYPMPKVRPMTPDEKRRDDRLRDEFYGRRGSGKEDQYSEAAKRLVDAMAQRGPGNRRRTPTRGVRLTNTQEGNPRQGRSYTSMIDRLGRKVHDYGNEKVVVGTRRRTRRKKAA